MQLRDEADDAESDHAMEQGCDSGWAVVKREIEALGGIYGLWDQR